MTLRHGLLTALLLGATLSTAQAYKLLEPTDRDQIPVPYKVNPSRMPLGVQAINQCAQRWGSQPSVDFSFRYTGTSSSGQNNSDGVSVIFMDRGQMGQNVHGVTFRYMSVPDNKLLGWDMAINGREQMSQDRFYNVVTHEFGHALGLDHSENPRAVMWATGGTSNGRYRRDLHADDIAGAAALYPRAGGNPGVVNANHGGNNGLGGGNSGLGGGSTGGSSGNGGPVAGPRSLSLGTPTITAPRGQVAGQGLTIEWTGVQGAQNYEVALDSIVNGRQVKVQRATVRTTNLMPLTPQAGTYVVFVRAISQGRVGQWANSRFTVGGTQPGTPSGTSLGAVSFSTPREGQVLEPRPVLRWNGVGADSFEVAIDVIDPSGQRSKVLRENVTGHELALTQSLAPGNYWAFVRGVKGSTKGQWANARFEVTHPVGMTSVIAPMNEVQSVSEFTWEGVSDATHYELRVDVADGSGTMIHEAALTGTSLKASGFTAQVVHHWWVRAFKGSQAGPWAAGAFRIARLDAPSLVAPKGQIETGDPTFTWSAVAGAKSYELVIEDPSFDVTLAREQVQGTSHTLGGDLGPGDYRWKVRARSGKLLSEFSSEETFSVEAKEIPAPAILAPQGPVADLRPLITWTAVPDATYELWLGEGDSEQALFHVRDLQDTRYVPTEDLEPGHAYRFWVRARVEGHTSGWSGQVFHVTAPDRPAALAPKGRIDSQQPDFRWSAMTGAQRYEIQVQRVSGRQIVLHEVVTGTEMALPMQLELGHTYRWRVRAWMSSGSNASEWDVEAFAVYAPMTGMLARLSGAPEVEGGILDGTDPGQPSDEEPESSEDELPDLGPIPATPPGLEGSLEQPSGLSGGPSGGLDSGNSGDLGGGDLGGGGFGGGNSGLGGGTSGDMGGSDLPGEFGDNQGPDLPSETAGGPEGEEPPVADSTAPEETTPSAGNPEAGLKFIHWPSQQRRSDRRWGPVLTDIVNHLPARYGNTYFDSDLVTTGHETTHGINSHLRNHKNDSGRRANGFYVLRDRGVIIPEPPVRKSAAARFVPVSLREMRYKTYVTGSQSWDDTPLYLFDEWVAYTNGNLVALDRYKQGIWKEGWRDTFGGVEFTVYVFALAQGIEAQRPGYLQSAPQLKAFLAWNARRTMEAYHAMKNLEPFRWPKLDTYLQRIRTAPDAEGLRAFVRQLYGPAWAKQVMGF